MIREGNKGGTLYQKKGHPGEGLQQGPMEFLLAQTMSVPSEGDGTDQQEDGKGPAQDVPTWLITVV